MADVFGYRIHDYNGDPITGGAADTWIKFLRVVDGYLFDFNDGTFKTSGWTTLTTALAESDATNDAGFYKKSQDLAGWDDGFYHAIYHYDDGSNVALPHCDVFYVKNGKLFTHYVATEQDLDTAFTDVSSLTSDGFKERIRRLMWVLINKMEVTDANGNTVIYKDDSLTTAFSVAAALTDDSTTTTRKRIE